MKGVVSNVFYISVFCLIVSCERGRAVETLNEEDTYECNSLKESLNDFRAQSSYIRMKVNFGNKSSILVIQNTSLFSFFQAKYDFNKTSYQAYLYPKIKSDSVINLSLSDSILFEGKFLPIKSDTCNQLSLILKTYFSDDMVQKKTIPDELCVISLLIQNSYRVWQDDETGYLIIRKCD